MYKIVVTGGPCAGKTTAINRIKKEFEGMGYSVLVVPETATELITGGVAPWTLKSVLEYQLCQMKLQIEKEKIFEEVAGKLCKSDKVIIICDRGLMDNKAYMTEADFDEAVSELNLNETEMRDGYDAVFHLVTAAKGPNEVYTLRNNQARTETAEEAAAIDDRLISAWTGHPHLRIIDNTKKIETKIQKLIKEISAFIGEPEHLEIERKFLIEYPDIKYLEESPYCRKVEITQMYLNSDDEAEIRIRRRGEAGKYMYFKTVKKKVDEVKRFEIETRLSEEEYMSLAADASNGQISKTRYCLVYKNRYFEIDVYPFWDDKAIMEIELCDENEHIVFPEFIKIIKEVTGDEDYKNSSLAKKNGV